MRRPHPAISLMLTASVGWGLGGAVVYGAPSAATSLVRIGQAEDFTHIEFAGASPRSVHRDGGDLVLQFAPGVALAGVAELNASPPRQVAHAAVKDGGSGPELRLTLAEGATVKVGRGDGSVYVNLYPGETVQPSPADQTAEHADNPVPASGVVRVRPSVEPGAVSLRFDWRAPVGAAVFRRGDAIWIVFDAKAVVDATAIPAGLAEIAGEDAVASASATVLKLRIPPRVQASAFAQGASWIVRLSTASPSDRPLPVELKADAGGLAAQVAGASGVFWIDDPAVGDRLAVVTAPGPAKGVAVERRLVDATVYASAQGLALSPLVADLHVSSDGDVVRIGRPRGLEVSSTPAADSLAAASGSLPAPAAMPGLVDPSWAASGDGGFLKRYRALQEVAAVEGGQEHGATTVGRFGLARFLVGSDLAFEAIGVLDLVAKTNPQVLSTAEFRGLRGAARVMAGRYKDAAVDLASPALAEDPASALWRGYVAAKLGDVATARQAFAAGRPALPLMASEWRTRFLLAQGQAAIAGGDLAGARLLLESARDLKPEGVDADRLQLEAGDLANASGQPQEALNFYAAAEVSDYGGVSAPALLHVVELRSAKGELGASEAAQTLASVRFRWRGDATEIEATRALGRLYIAQGRYREALGTLRSSENASPELPASAALHGDLQSAFKALFLDGAADGLPPIQALGLFFDFKDLTPIGADGDAMVRKLARRLVDVDLLEQAGQLLKYQADNRLDGVAKAEVDTDLALIEVMDRRPEDALDALNGSRSTLLPPDLQSRRRVIQSRALAALGRYDDAMEILETDGSHDAQAARAEIAWRRHDWPQAGKLLEVSLGGRFRSDAPLDDQDAGDLLRAAIAYSLAGDEAGLTRLRTRYAKQAEGNADAPLLKVALAGSQSAYGPADLAAADSFPAWVAAMKGRLVATGALKA